MILHTARLAPEEAVFRPALPSCLSPGMTEMQVTDIPKKGTGRKALDTSLIGRIRALPIGGYVEVPRRQETSAYMSAKKSGIKISTRRMGSADTTRIYRVDDEGGE